MRYLLLSDGRTEGLNDTPGSTTVPEGIAAQSDCLMRRER